MMYKGTFCFVRLCNQLWVWHLRTILRHTPTSIAILCYTIPDLPQVLGSIKEAFEISNRVKHALGKATSKCIYIKTILTDIPVSLWTLLHAFM